MPGGECCVDFCVWLCESGAGGQNENLEEIGIGRDTNGSETIEDAMMRDQIDGGDCGDSGGIAVTPANGGKISSSGSSYKIKQLFNSHGYNLAIMRGHVKGVREAFSPHAVLQLKPVGVGEVKIQGLESGLYLAMNSKGQLYAEEDETNEATVFIESSNGHFLIYLSKKFAHHGWYVGITKEGRGKNGKKTWYPWGQKAIQFVSRKPYAEPHPLRQIRNRHGQTLTIMPDGKVCGSTEEAPGNKSAILEFIPTIPTGAYRIRGIDANLYLAMDSKGNLYGEEDHSDGSTLFAEHSVGVHYVYLSVRYAHMGWHIGIKKNGKAKKGKRTAFPPGQKAIQFLRKPIVPVTPALGKGLDLAQRLDSSAMAFIDDDDQGDSSNAVRGPQKVGTLK